MKKTINRYEFASWFAEHRPNNFSPIGRMELYDMLTEFEDATGEEIEFDPIALCCEYSEYANLEEIQEAYPSHEFKSWDDVEHETTVIRVEWEDDGRAIILDF